MLQTHPTTLVELSGSDLRFCTSVHENPCAVLDAALLSAATGATLSTACLTEARQALESRKSLPSGDLRAFWTGLSSEDLRTFWMSLTKTPGPSNALRLLRDTGWDQLFPDLVAVQGVPQAPEWHPEGDVWEHTLQATDAAVRLAAAAGLGGRDRLVAVLGALCHDFGKATHTQVSEDGSVTSPGHDEAGEAPTLSFVLTAGFDPSVARAVAALVRDHMGHTNQSPSSSALTRLQCRLEASGASFRQWCVVADADGAGRGSASSDGAADAWRATFSRREALRALRSSR